MANEIFIDRGRASVAEAPKSTDQRKLSPARAGRAWAREPPPAVCPSLESLFPGSSPSAGDPAL